MLKTIDYKVPDGKMLKIKLDIEGESIKSIIILGDFFLHPESTIEQIEANLVGCKIDMETITARIQEVLDNSNSTLLGAKADDIAKAIDKAFLEYND